MDPEDPRCAGGPLTESGPDEAWDLTSRTACYPLPMAQATQKPPSPHRPPEGPPEASEQGSALRIAEDSTACLSLELAGRLDSSSLAELWTLGTRTVERSKAHSIRLDLTAVTHCDAAGARFLVTLKELAGERPLEWTGVSPSDERLMQLVTPKGTAHTSDAPHLTPIARLGRLAIAQLDELRQLIAFTGEFCVMLARCVVHPRELRFRDVIRVSESAGIGAIPIVLLIGFLLGLILSFQSAIPMRRFGAQVFIADLLGISLLRELGPLMASILLAARSGSAFAAELGTMRVNEEIDALTTMGLEPVRFLVLPRVIAAVLVVPTLALLMNVAGLAGGAVVYLSLELPVATFLGRVADAATAGDMLGGLFKGCVFGLLVGAIGCLRGLQAGSGAGAVGDAATRSVVSAIILITISDGIFAVLFYSLGI